MKMKALVLALTVAVGATLFAGCAKQAATTTTTPAASTSTAAKTDSSAKADAVTGASQTTDEASFEKAISKDNKNYMVITNQDLTFTKDLIVEAGVKKGTDGTEAPNRALGLAHETKGADGKSVVDKRYTLTVPSLVFAGENGKIEYGIIKGDVYVQAKGFTIKDATIDGNLYFANDDLKNAFKQDATTKISGQVAVKAYAAK